MTNRRSRRAQAVDRRDTPPNKGQEGVPVDAYGGQTVDPTKNVLDLVNASVRRTDDLREAETRRVDELLTLQFQHATEIANLRSDCLKEVAGLRAKHTEELALAEAKRIDAIRLIDTQAVGVASEKQSAAAGVLATQVTTSAETLRALVATNAQAVAAQLVTIVEPITSRLALLEKALYEGQGKQTVSDPALAQLAEAVRKLTEFSAQGAGRSTGMAAVWGYVLGAAGAASLLYTVALKLSGH